MADTFSVTSPDLIALRKSFAEFATSRGVRSWAIQGTEALAKTVVTMADANIRSRGRERGEHWKRSNAHVYAQAKGDGWETKLETPWLGVEFGGKWQNVWGNWVHQDRMQMLGSSPMWAPWHRDQDQGYIMGSAWAELERTGDVTALPADAVMAGITQTFDQQGVPRG